MELGFSPTINNTFTGYQHVSTFANLPSASSYINQYFIVDSPSGIWLINRKEAGFYKSDGTNWNHVGSSVDMTSLSDGATSVTASPVTLQGTNGITTTSDTGNNKIMISGAALPQITSGSGAPTSTPTKSGNIYVDTTNYKTYISKGSSSSSDWIKQNGSYTIQASTSQTRNPTNATTYFFGALNTASYNLTTTYGAQRMPILRAGKITGCAGVFSQTAGSTTETSSLYLRLNDTTDYLIANNINNSGWHHYFSNTALSISVNVGDFIFLKWVTPSWVTPPAGVTPHATIIIDL